MDEKRLMRQLNKYLPNFVSQVNPEELLPYLSCLSPASKEEIRARQNNKGKTVAAQELHSHVVRYKERGVRELLDALRDENIGLEELADLIDPPSTKDNTATTVQKKTVQNDIARRPGVDENIRKIFDRDTPLRHLPSSVYRVLRLLDSHDQIDNWESLAGNIGYTVEDVSRFRQNPHDGSPMIALYNDWRTREGSTLGHLMQILIKIERVDVYTELTNITGYQHQEDNGKQTGRNNYPPERLPGPVNPIENMGPIHLYTRQGKGNRIEKKGDLPGPEQHIGRGPSGPGEDNSMQNGGKKHPHEDLDKRFPGPINLTENAGRMRNNPRQGKDNRMEQKEQDLPGPERQHISRGGSGSGEGINKNENDLTNKDNVKRNSVESSERSSKVQSHEKDTEHVVCSVVKANIEKVIVGALDEHLHQIEEQDLVDPSTSTESEESNSRVDSSPSNRTLHADPRNNYKEFHKEKHHNKDVLTSEMRKEEENKINKVEQQDYKSDVGQQLDQKVYVETPSYEMVPSPKDASCSVMSEEENTSGDTKQMNERKKCTDETLEEGQCVPVPTERVSMETNKPVTSTLEFQVYQKGKRLPDEHMIEREQEPSTAKERFTNDIDQMRGGQDGKQSPKTILNEQVAGIKVVQMTSSLLPELHKGFGSLGFVPMTIEEDHFVAYQGSTFSHEGDTIAHQDKASSQQNEGVSHLDAEKENTHPQQHIVHAEPDDIPATQKDTNVKRDNGFQAMDDIPATQKDTSVKRDNGFQAMDDIPATQKDTNVKRDNGFQAMDDIQVLQSSSVQGGSSSRQQDDINRGVRSSAQRGVNHGWYFIIGLGIVIGACFIVRRVKKSS